MRNLVSSFAKDTSGATAIEYGLIAALIAVTIIFSVTTVGQRLSGSYEQTSTGVATANR